MRVPKPSATRNRIGIMAVRLKFYLTLLRSKCSDFSKGGYHFQSRQAAPSACPVGRADGTLLVTEAADITLNILLALERVEKKDKIRRECRLEMDVQLKQPRLNSPDAQVDPSCLTVATLCPASPCIISSSLRSVSLLCT